MCASIIEVAMDESDGVSIMSLVDACEIYVFAMIRHHNYCLCQHKNGYSNVNSSVTMSDFYCLKIKKGFYF